MTQEDVIDMAREALKQEPREDWNSTAWVFADETLEAFANLVAAKEREACAKVCDELPAPNVYSDSDKGMWDIASLACADAIRARGEQA